VIDPLTDLADTPLETLLASVDNALTTGSDMNNANLAFLLLCDRLGVDRDALVFDRSWSTRPVPPVKTPCPEGFHWIGQSFAVCDKCALPAWEHEGVSTPARDNPFDNGGWVLRPWAPGEREACRAKWAPTLGGGNS
jgi:hypothetical protein